jgi:hypothetical protein
MRTAVRPCASSRSKKSAATHSIRQQGGAIRMHKSVLICGILLLFTSAALAQDVASIGQKTFSCAEPTGILYAEVYQPIGYHGAYTGHDEPSVLFYSNTAGSGNTMVYFLQ